MRKFLSAIIALAILPGVASINDKPSVSRLTLLPLDMSDLFMFMDIQAWKCRLTSNQPFNAVETRVSLYERSGNGPFMQQSVGEWHEIVSVENRHEQIVAVIWKKEESVLRFQLSYPGLSRVDHTLPAERLRGYEIIGPGVPLTGMELDGEHILAVKWKKNENGVIIRGYDKHSMDGYLAVEFELKKLKGIGD